MKWKLNVRRHRFAVGSSILACAVFFLAAQALSADKETASINDTRAALEKWVETKRIISKEKLDLALAKEMLNERISLIQREIGSLRDKIKEAEKSIEDADKKRAELFEENEKLKQASASLMDTLVALENRIAQLLPRLPDPIRERIKPLSQRLPNEKGETKLSLGERFQNAIGMLNEIDKFNREISVNSEVRELPDGSSAEVTSLYLGIGQGYYTGANGTVAGVGFPTEKGWTWTSANEAAAQIAQAIAILKNERVASFVQLPLEIH